MYSLASLTSLPENVLPSAGMAAEDKAKKRVLVLGAGGYVGRHLVATLSRTDWALPVAAVRSMPAAASALPSVKLLSYDARSPSALDGRLGDIDCVVNCVAGDASSMVVQDENRMLLPNELQSQADAIESCADRVYSGPKEVPSSIFMKLHRGWALSRLGAGCDLPVYRVKKR